MEWAEFFHWGVQGLIGGGLAFAVKLLSDMNQSIKNINSQITAMGVDTTWIKKEMDRHDERLTSVEQQDSPMKYKKKHGSSNSTNRGAPP